MNEFTFAYPTKVYFGEGAAEKALKAELEKAGQTVMLALWRRLCKEQRHL